MSRRTSERPLRPRRPRSPARALFLVGAALSGALSPAAEAAAQELPGWGVMGGGVTFQSFHFSDEDAAVLSSVSLLSVPVAVQARPFGPLRLEVSGGFARGEMERPDGSTTTISGLVDTRIRVGVDRLADDRLSVSAIALLPTGEDRFTGEEGALAGLVAADLLPFRTSSWSSGGGFGADASFVQPVGFGNVMINGTFIVPREFDAVEGVGGTVTRYQAGPVFRIGAGLDREIGSASRLSFRVSAQRFGDDELEGQTLFRTGNRFQFLSSYAFPMGFGGSGIAYAGYLHRTRGTSVFPSTDDRPRQGLVYGGVGLRKRWGSTVFVPSLEGRVVQRESDQDEGFLGGVGLAVERPVRGVLVVPSATLRAGRLQVRDGVSSSILGFEVGLSIRRGAGGGVR